ncbi:MAG: outer membrane protein transport protein [Ignavibacteriae bacterium]|nr:outer membrane protein transport protein [Ignavibacteriota bacterium]
MKKYISFLAFGFVLIMASASAEAQSIEDALRYSIPNGIITPRVAGFNVSYHGLSDDIGALMYNPAGLTIPASSEISVGFGFTRNSSETDYLNVKNLLNTNDELITNLGIIVPIDTKKNKASIGIGYFLESNFENNMKFDAFNPKSTFIADEAAYGPNRYYDNIATYLNLADRNFNTPLKDSLQQSALIQEKGGLHNLTGGLAYDISDVISVGFSIVGKWGTYKYTKNYTETDILHKYEYWDTSNFTNIDFHQLNMTEDINADITGISGSVGFQARLMESLRFGITIKLPTWYEISEKFSWIASAEFDKNIISDSAYVYDGNTSYNVTTPFVYCAGLSFNFQGLTLTGGVEYSDASQIEFSRATAEVEKYNQDIIQQLTGQVTYGFGAEYQLPVFPAFVRASFASTTSPYIDNNPNSNLTIISFGGGLFIGDKVRLDALVRMRDYTDKRINYADLAYNFTLKPVDFGLQLTYRY